MALKSVLLLGGNGKVARHITSQLAAKSVTVHSVIRSESQVPELTKIGASPIVQSIENSSISDFAALIKDKRPDAVIWAAGAGGGSPERTKSVDHEGAVKAIDAAAQSAKEHGTTRRYVTISALDVRDKERKPVPDWYDEEDKNMSDRVWKAIPIYLEAKLAADKALVEGNASRNLQYTIVRPSGLSEDPAKGKVSAGKVRLGKSISRADVAGVVIAALENDDTHGLAFDCAGGDDDIKEAIAKVAKEKIDTFEGFH